MFIHNIQRPSVAGAEPPVEAAKGCQAAHGRRLDGQAEGPGDHVQYAHPAKPGKVTLDMGADPIPTGTLRSIYRQAGYRQAGWDW